MKTIAFIPLRGNGSIPGKNTKIFAGKPLFHWVIQAAHNCGKIDRIFVAADVEEIRASVKSLGLDRVELLEKCDKDMARSDLLMLELAEKEEFEKIVLIQSSSPLLRAADLTEGLAVMERNNADSLVTVVAQKRFNWSVSAGGNAAPLNYDPLHRPRRQEFKPGYVENGAFYVSTREGLRQSKSRLFGKIAAHIMAEETFFKVDDPMDWDLVECLMKTKLGFTGNAPAETVIVEKKVEIQSSGAAASTESLPADFSTRAKKIKLFLIDVDGFLTDGGMYYTEKGDEQKKFNSRDAKAFELLRSAGIKTAVISTDETKIVERHIKKLKADFLFQGMADKMPAYEMILRQTGFSREEIAVLSDDVADLPLFKVAGLSVAPADAPIEVREAGDVCCQAKGGGGCMFEFARLILSNQG